MKLNYSNKLLLDSISSSYDIKQAGNTNKILFTILGVAAGAMVTAYFFNSHQRKVMNEITANFQKQIQINNQLRIQNQNTRQRLNYELMKQSEFVNSVNDSIVTEVTS
jgi:hypothetical protein